MKILIVLTSHAVLGTTGKPTGYYLPELTHALAVFQAAGLDIDYASPLGGAAPMDGADRKDPLNAAFLDDAKQLERVKNTRALEAVNPAEYAAVYVPGGHGTMWDLPQSKPLQRVIASVWEAGGVVGAVCHGPSALVDVMLSSGEPLVKGHTVSAFTNEEEAAVGLTGVVPFLLESKLRERGAEHVAGPKFAAKVVADGRLVTGQNPASTKGVAEGIVAALTKR